MSFLQSFVRHFPGSWSRGLLVLPLVLLGACNGAGAGECEDSERNECGGCARLEDSPGAPCGDCRVAVFECSEDGESLVCPANGCEAPLVKTHPVSGVEATVASFEGEILSPGGSELSGYGFCLGQERDPSHSNGAKCESTHSLNAERRFFAQTSFLQPNTSYFVRAYAINTAGTGYGETNAFQTPDVPLPRAEVLELKSPEEGVVVVSARLSVMGVPPNSELGVCLGLSDGTNIDEQSSHCLPHPKLEAPGDYSLRFESLKPGLTYSAVATATSSLGRYVSPPKSITLAPLPPLLESVSDGSDPLKVSLAWKASEGATGYRVYRDGVPLGSGPVSGLLYEDLEASPAGAPENEGLEPSASREFSDKVVLNWGEARVPSAPRHQYTVRALNAAGESRPSEALEGARAPFPVTGYQVSVGEGPWTSPTGALTHEDTSAPVGTLSPASVTASQGTSSNFVDLELDGGEPLPGTEVLYRVRALNASGPGAPSAPVSGQRGPFALSYQWQRSSGTTNANFSDLPGATTPLHQDTTAPENADPRFYRLVLSGGPSPVTTAAVSGYRAVGRPELETLAPTLSGDTQATLRGRVTKLGTTPITEHGYCYSAYTWVSSQYPTPTYPTSTYSKCVQLGPRSATGTMSNSTITVALGMEYKVRAFAVTSSQGSPVVSYGPLLTFVTRPKQPAAPQALFSSEQVRLSWTPSVHVSQYILKRNGTTIATLQSSGVTGMSYDDRGAPPPPVPGEPQIAISNEDCSSAILNLKAPEPRDGDRVNYTLIAENAAGQSLPSTDSPAYRLAYPFQGYILYRGSNQTSLSASTTSYILTDLPKPSITPPHQEDVTASRGNPSHITLTSYAPTLGPVPDELIVVKSVNAQGLSRGSAQANARRRVCNVTNQWQKMTGLFIFTDIPGARSLTYVDYNASATTSTFYRVKHYTASDNVVFGPIVQGWRAVP